jgi:PAS domain S-box-containing protein
MSQPPHHILRDAAIAAHASSARPAWLFSSDGARLLFANAAGAAMLGLVRYDDAARFAVPRDLAARVARSIETLRPHGHPRLERLRGLGTAFGQPLTCTCARIESASGSTLLVVATEAADPAPTLRERARYLVEGDAAAAAFGADGALVHASASASHLISATTSLADFGRGDGIETLHVGNGVDLLTLAFFPANSQPITSQSTGATTQPLLDLSPIAEAITAMTKVPPHRNGKDGAPREKAPSHATEAIGNQSPARAHPLRFFWETDAENRFTIDSDEFIALAGARTVNLLGRFWGELSAKLALDPEGLIAHALVSRDTWSGIEVRWPTTGSSVTVTLSGIPVFDHDKIFRGYRGLGVWHGDARAEASEPHSSAEPADAPQRESEPVRAAGPPVEPRSEVSSAADDAAAEAAPPSCELSHIDGTAEQSEDTAVARMKDASPQTENVVPFPFAPAEPKAGGLNAAERIAFRDLGSRLTSRLKGADELARGLIENTDAAEDPPFMPPVPMAAPQAQTHPQVQAFPEMMAEDDVLAAPRPVLDKLPLGILIYRGSNFIYANPAFLKFAGHASLPGFAEAGGLDTMFVAFEGGTDDAGGRRLRIATSDREPAMEGRLVTAPIEGENAMVLMLQPAAPVRPAVNETDATELSALLDIAADGAVTIDRDAMIVSANARAETLFGYDSGTLTGRSFGDLFAPESERAAKARLGRLIRGDSATCDESCEIVGRRRQGRLVPLQLTLGRADNAGTRFHALFRDMTRWKETEKEMTAARQQAEKASAAKSEFLARISHEMRTPLNAIIGFSEVMMEERFGPVGNERYRDYLKDINTSGAHLVSLLNDLLDLSKIEAGKMELSFERVDLNEVTQQAVAIIQAQASRARVIVRTALSMNIPGIVADTRSVRQIVLNLLSNSVKFTGAGGQVIVSTASNDRGDVTLRVRDTGIGMSEKDLETALQPFRQLTTSSRTDTNGTGLGLPLTKALVEANRARFSIKSAVNAGTLVEIVFPAARAFTE